MKNVFNFSIHSMVAMFIFFYTTSNLNAQIIITSEDFPSATGTFIVTEDDTVDTVEVDLGYPGENQVWRLELSFPAEFSHQLLVDRLETNFADTFPSSNLVSLYAGKLGYLIHSYYFDNTEGVFYTYQLNSKGSFVVQGIGFERSIVNFGGFKFSYSGPVDISPDMLLFNFPLEYSDSCQAVSNFSVKIDTILLGNHAELMADVRDSTFSIVDGWGTLILPTNSYECLRVKSYITLWENLYANGVLFRSQKTRTINYTWITQNYGIVARVISHSDVMDDNFKFAKQISCLFKFNPEIQFSIGDTIGAPGDTLELPIFITDATGLNICDIKMKLNYNTNILSNVEVNTSGSLCELWTKNYFASDSGLAIELSGSSSLGESGTLCYLKFIVNSGALHDENTVLEIKDVEFLEKGPKIKTNPGKLTVKYFYDVMGSINYYSTNQSISDVELNMSSHKCNTDANGQFIFRAIPQGEYELKPSKTNELKNSISPFDASMILRFVVGLDTLSPYQKVAADVTGNGQVSALDASQILRYVVGIINEFPVAEDWRFIPEHFDINDTNWSIAPDRIRYAPLETDQQNQNFKGIIYGDVSGNWTFKNQMFDKAVCSVATVVISDTVISANNEFIVPIKIKSDEEILSVKIDMSFDSQRIIFKNIKNMKDFGECQSIYSEKNGNLHIAIAAAQSLNFSKNGIQLTFSQRNPKSKLNTLIKLNHISLNENLIQADVLRDKLKLRTAPAIQFLLHQNYPNPFNSTTTILYEIPQNSHVKLLIYNTLGQLVKILADEDLERGEYNVQWDGKGYNEKVAPTGVYFYCLKSSSENVTHQIIQKMILIR